VITARQIREARKRAGWSQAELAKRVRVSGRTVGGWERGESAPGMSEPRLLDALRPYIGSESATGDHSLRRTSDAELLAEIARRFSRDTKEAGSAHGNSTEKIIEGSGEPIEPLPDQSDT